MKQAGGIHEVEKNERGVILLDGSKQALSRLPHNPRPAFRIYRQPSKTRPSHTRGTSRVSDPMGLGSDDHEAPAVESGSHGLLASGGWRPERLEKGGWLGQGRGRGTSFWGVMAELFASLRVKAKHESGLGIRGRSDKAGIMDQWRGEVKMPERMVQKC